MLDYITSKDRDEVFATSLIRLVSTSGDAVFPLSYSIHKRSFAAGARSSADALQHVQTREAVQALVAATSDDYRLVRVRSAASLAGYPDLP